MAGWDLTKQMHMQFANCRAEGGCVSVSESASPSFATSLTRVYGGMCVASTNGSTAKVGHIVGDPSNGYMDFTCMEATAGPWFYFMWGV